MPEPARRQALTAAIRQLNASAEVHETTRCHLHLEHILGRGILHNPAPLGEADGCAHQRSCWRSQALAQGLAAPCKCTTGQPGQLLGQGTRARIRRLRPEAGCWRRAATVQEAPQAGAGPGPFKAGSLGAKEALAARGFADEAVVHVHDSGVGSCTLHAGAVDLDKYALLPSWHTVE